MTRPDDSPTDMDSHDLSDEQIESLLAGSPTPPGFEDVAAGFAGLRDFGSRVGDVAVSAQLGEFVTRPSTPPVGPPLVPVSAVVSPDQPRRKHMIAGVLGTTAAKLALAGGIAVAGVTGAHAVGLVDVPLLPGQNDPIEFVSATQPAQGDETPPTPAPLAGSDEDPTGSDDAETPSAPTEPTDTPSLDGTINMRVGDAEFSITIDGSGDGDLSIKVDVEGVSPSCEAALEALGDLTDVEAFESAGQDVEQACAEDFADLGDFDHFGDQFGKDFGDIEGLLEDLDLGDLDLGDVDLEGLLEDLDLGDLDLEGLLEGQDFSQFEELLEGLDLGDLDGLLDGQGLGDLEGLIEDLLPQLEGN